MSERRESPDFHCPGCGHLSGMVIGTEQAVCTNDKDCLIVIFNPSERYGPEDFTNAQRLEFARIEKSATYETGGIG